MASQQPGLAGLHRELLKKLSSPVSLAPYMSTQKTVVEKLVDLCCIRDDDTVFDIGCGDGRLMLAALRAGARHVTGWDVDAAAISEATSLLTGKYPRSTWDLIHGDVFSQPIAIPWANASVLLLYLGVRGNLMLRDQIFRDCKDGTRALTVSFHMGSWEPVTTVTVEVPPGETHSDGNDKVLLSLFVVTEEDRQKHGDRAAEDLAKFQLKVSGS